MPSCNWAELHITPDARYDIVCANLTYATASLILPGSLGGSG